MARIKTDPDRDSSVSVYWIDSVLLNKHDKIIVSHAAAGSKSSLEITLPDGSLLCIFDSIVKHYPSKEAGDDEATLIAEWNLTPRG